MNKPRLKSKELLNRYGGDKTLYRIAKDGDVNYTTLHRWLSEEDINGISIDVLLGFFAGMGMSTDMIRSLSLGDVIEVPEP